MNLSVCVEMFFNELAIQERIGKVAEAGYSAAEFWGTDGRDIEAIAAAAREHGVEIVSMVGCGISPGLNDPAVHDDLVARLRKAIEAANIVGCTRLIVMAGNALAKVTRWAQTQAIIEGLNRMGPIAKDAGVELVLENLNTTHDHAGYFLDSSEELASIIRAVNHPNVKGLLDIYHAGIMEGNMIEKIGDQIETIGHFHIAGIPGRNEPMAGEQNYPAIARAIDAAGFDGHMGLEYVPLKDHHESLVETRLWICDRS